MAYRLIEAAIYAVPCDLYSAITGYSYTVAHDYTILPDAGILHFR